MCRISRSSPLAPCCSASLVSLMTSNCVHQAQIYCMLNRSRLKAKLELALQTFTKRTANDNNCSTPRVNNRHCVRNTTQLTQLQRGSISTRQAAISTDLKMYAHKQCRNLGNEQHPTGYLEVSSKERETTITKKFPPHGKYFHNTRFCNNLQNIKHLAKTLSLSLS